MEKRDTRQKILEAALGLFSVHGYDGVSVRDIAGAVGIKDSSLNTTKASRKFSQPSLMK